jgi:hypothetical protein
VYRSHPVWPRMVLRGPLSQGDSWPPRPTGLIFFQEISKLHQMNLSEKVQNAERTGQRVESKEQGREERKSRDEREEREGSKPQQQGIQSLAWRCAWAPFFVSAVCCCLLLGVLRLLSGVCCPLLLTSFVPLVATV